MLLPWDGFSVELFQVTGEFLFLFGHIDPRDHLGQLVNLVFMLRPNLRLATAASSLVRSRCLICDDFLNGAATFRLFFLTISF